MPDELELLEIQLNAYVEYAKLLSENNILSKSDFKIVQDTIIDVRNMVEKVKQQIKDFEDTVSGSGG